MYIDIDLKEIEKFYILNPDGTVYIKKLNRLAKLTRDNTGYERVSINTGNGARLYTLHRLIAYKFVKGKTRWRSEVNHKDLCKHNNDHTNLEWVTHIENIHHMRRNREVIPNPPRKDIRNKAILVLKKEGFTFFELSGIFGITKNRIRNICNGIRR